jgi:hypothetical protein
MALKVRLLSRHIPYPAIALFATEDLKTPF